MSDLDEISKINKELLDPTIVRTQGAGKAYQSVAQSMAIAVQDGTNYLENVLTISTAAIGVAMSKIVANPYENIPKYQPVIEQAGKTIEMATKNLANIGKEAGEILKNFPSG
ncbi:MAG: hypothetical protein AB4062_15040 [Crocosphaera sp.]